MKKVVIFEKDVIFEKVVNLKKDVIFEKDVLLKKHVLFEKRGIFENMFKIIFFEIRVTHIRNGRVTIARCSSKSKRPSSQI